MSKRLFHALGRDEMLAVLGAIERVREAERELIESPDEEFRFHSGVPASL